MNDLKPRADLSAVSSMLRRYAHFEGDTTPPPATPPEKTATPAGTNGGTEGEKKVFTQEDVEFHAKERAKTAAQSERKKVYAELGIEDPDADKETLAAAKKRKADEQTEVEKTTAELTKEKAKREAAETELKSFQEKVEAEKRTEKRNGAITKALTDPKTQSLIAIPDDVVLWSETNAADLLAKVLKEDGSVDDATVTALVKKCREARPKWFPAPPPGTGSHTGGRNPQGTPPKVVTSGRL